MATQATRWGVDAPDSDAAARARILQASRACYLRRGVGGTTVEDIAREANIHRTTVYTYFRNRDEVLAGVLQAELRPLAARAEALMQGEGSFVDRLVETLAAAAQAIQASPLLSLLYASENVAVTMRVARTSAALRERTHRALTGHVAAAVASGELRRDVPPEAIARWLMRTNEMLLERSDDDLDGGLGVAMRTFVAPAIVASAAPLVDR